MPYIFKENPPPKKTRVHRYTTKVMNIFLKPNKY